MFSMRLKVGLRMAKARPLSPHLSVWRFQLPAVMSILHRITGVAISSGTILLAAWVIALASGEAAFATMSLIIGHPLGQLVLFGYSAVLFYHMCNGIRHLSWDFGYGLNIPSIYTTGRIAFVAAILMTAALWLYVYLA